jgi:hypothetical protein
LRLAGACLLAGAAGGILWGVPLVVASGGPTVYWRALFSQAAEDLSGVQMLSTRPTVRELASALWLTLAASWARWEVAFVVWGLAALGVVHLLRRARVVLLALAAAFVPYLVFHLLFQETLTTRYALPLIVPIAYLAAEGAVALGPRIGVPIVVALSAFDAHIAGTSVAAYARQPPPAVRLLEDMRSAAKGTEHAAVFAADRRNALDFRRPITWAGDYMPRLDRLPAPPKHEWLEAVKYWNAGGRAPMWFVVDPKRAQMDLVDHPDPIQYRWPLPYPGLIGGARPNEMDWYRVDRPEWYVGEGWALTPEAAGTAAEDGRGPGFAPIQAWIRRRTEPVTMIVGGRNLGVSSSSRVKLAVAGQPADEWVAAPGFFLRLIQLPSMPAGGGDYVNVSIAADTQDLAIEQFDVAPRDHVVFGFGAGWHEQEYDSRTGRRWRWLSERGELRVRSVSGPLTLRIEGESPRNYYPRPSRLLVRLGDSVLLDEKLSSDFSVTATIPPQRGDPAGVHQITLETDQVFAPADRSRRSADRRHLGLRIFNVRLVPAS